MKRLIMDYIWIAVGSILYAVATILFIFPHSLLLGGTSGLSVILNTYVSISPSSILVIINFLLIIIAFVMLGKEMAIKTLAGSTLTTMFIGLFGCFFGDNIKIVENIYISMAIGACIIAIASGIMFYVKSSSGGTDIIALILRKYLNVNIGRALLITDILIVLIGGYLSGVHVFVGSVMGLLIKTFGIDIVISKINI